MKTSALVRSSQCVTGGLKNGHAEVHFTIFSHKLLDSEAITLKANRLAWHTQSRLGWQYVTVPDKRDHFRQNKKVTYFTENKNTSYYLSYKHTITVRGAEPSPL